MGENKDTQNKLFSEELIDDLVAEIGTELSVTPQRIAEIEKSIKGKKTKHPKHSKLSEKLKDYIEE